MTFSSYLKRLRKKYHRDAIKVLIVAIIVFTLITIKNKKSEETTYDVPSLPSEVTDVAMEFEPTTTEPVIELAPEEHAASGLNTGKNTAILGNYVQLCQIFSSLCTVTKFNGTFTEDQKAEYFGEIVQIVMNTDEIKTKGYSLLKVLKQILINASKGARRGSSGWTKMTLNLGGMKYENEFFQVFTHELGHIIDLGALNGKSRVRSTLFTEFGEKNFAIDDPSIPFYSLSWQSETIRKEGMTQEDFCSGYGMSDPFEDFAECHNLYLNHQDLFKQLAKSNSLLQKKYEYFDELYQKNYFSNSQRSLPETENYWRPRDTTRILE